MSYDDDAELPDLSEDPSTSPKAPAEPYQPGWYFRAGYIEPRELGCKCDVCPLGQLRRETGTWRPVPPEIWPGRSPKLSIIAEAPGPSEVQARRPQIGRGWEYALKPALDAQGIRRDEVIISNALLCQPLNNDLKALTQLVKKKNAAVAAENVQRAKRGEPLQPAVPSPLDCCRPALLPIVQAAPNVLVLGGSPWRSLTGEDHAVRSIRGAFMERFMIPETGTIWRPTGSLRANPPAGLVHLRMTATWNPAYVLRAPGWAPVFAQDVGRWSRWLRGELTWKNHELIRNPSPDELERVLFGHPWLSIDVETDGKEHDAANLRCIGFSDVPEGKTAWVVHFRSVDGKKRLGDEHEVLIGDKTGWYTPDDAARVRDILRRYFTDKRYTKAGHNFGYFDAAILMRELELPEIPGIVDQILLARTAHSELPRDLYTVGTLCTDVPDWKVNHEEDRKIATNAASDQELAEYNAIDCVVVSRCLPELVKTATERQQWDVLRVDHGVQQVCREMHQMGLYVDQKVRREWEVQYATQIEDQTKAIQDAVGSSTYNPNSPQQLAKFLFGECKLPVLSLTASGDPGTDDVVLRELIIRWQSLANGRGPQIRDAIQLHRALRTDVKRYGTVILPMRMWNDYRIVDGKPVGGLCRRDGRVHPHYNVHTPATGRISSSGPNSQNFEKWLRAMCIPEDGNIYVGADYDQIELRLICGVAGVQSYIDVFNVDGDPHGVTAHLIYADDFLKAYLGSLCAKHRAEYDKDGIIRKLGSGCGCKKASGYEPLRNFAKTFVYAIIYGGSAMTIFETVASAEYLDGPKKGQLMFPDMTLGMVKAATRRWLEGAKEIPAYWEELLEFGESHRYTREPIMGRVRGCPGGSKDHRNEILNFPIQGGAGIIVGKALLRLREALPPDYRRHHGIVNQMHDAITIEVPIQDGPYWQERIGEVLTAREAAAPNVTFSAAGQIAQNWKEAA